MHTRASRLLMLLLIAGVSFAIAAEAAFAGPVRPAPRIWGGYSPAPRIFGGYTPQPKLFGGYSPAPRLFGGYTPQPRLFGGYTPEPRLFGGYVPQGVSPSAPRMLRRSGVIVGSLR
jgi:hypothetical protein